MALKTNKRSRKNRRNKKTRALLKRKRATIRGGELYACSETGKKLGLDCESAMYDEIARLNLDVNQLITKEIEPNLPGISTLSRPHLERFILTLAKKMEERVSEFKQNVGDAPLRSYLKSKITDEDIESFSSFLAETQTQINASDKLTPSFKQRMNVEFKLAINDLTSLLKTGSKATRLKPGSKATRLKTGSKATLPKIDDRPVFAVRKVKGGEPKPHPKNPELDITDLRADYEKKYYVNPTTRTVYNYDSGEIIDTLKFDESTQEIKEKATNTTVESLKYSYEGCVAINTVKGIFYLHGITSNPNTTALLSPLFIGIAAASSGAYSLGVAFVSVIWNVILCNSAVSKNYRNI